jgi:hypothetical protein
MTAIATDQIEEIKKAEHKARKIIEDQQKQLQKQEEAFLQFLKEKKESHLNQIKKHGLTQLEKATEKASNYKKEKELEAERAIGSVISKAQAMENEALDLIETTFISQMKS